MENQEKATKRRGRPAREKTDDKVYSNVCVRLDQKHSLRLVCVSYYQGLSSAAFCKNAVEKAIDAYFNSHKDEIAQTFGFKEMAQE